MAAMQRYRRLFENKLRSKLCKTGKAVWKRGLLIRTSLNSQNVDFCEDTLSKSDDELGDISRYNLSSEMMDKLNESGIHHLYEIQQETFNHIKEGHDLLVQGHHGAGRSTSFVLPILEKLFGEEKDLVLEKSRKRLPTTLAITSSEERALHIFSHFQKFNSSDLKVSCFYTNYPFSRQEEELEEGTDILVGTPNRILDHIDRKTLQCSRVKHVIFDDIGVMFANGFKLDLEELLLKTESEFNKLPQLLLYSDLLPNDVQKTVLQWAQKRGPVKQLDFTLNESIFKSDRIAQAWVCTEAVKSSYWERIDDIVVRIDQSKCDSALIVCQTNLEGEVLHEKLAPLADRELLKEGSTEVEQLKAIRRLVKQKIKILICCCPSFDQQELPQIDLLIHTEPPYDLEPYHNLVKKLSMGGQSELSHIIYYREGDEDNIKNLEKQTRYEYKYSISSHKHKADKALAWVRAVDMTDKNNSDLVPVAKNLLNNSETTAEETLAVALAAVYHRKDAGMCSSLQTGQKGYKTFLLKQDWRLQSTTRVREILERYFDEDFMRSVDNMHVCLRRKQGCVFDIPVAKVKDVELYWPGDGDATLKAIETLPER